MPSCAWIMAALDKIGLYIRLGSMKGSKDCALCFCLAKSVCRVGIQLCGSGRAFSAPEAGSKMWDGMSLRGKRSPI